MPDTKKQQSPLSPNGRPAPAFEPDLDLITDMERGTKHDVSKVGPEQR